MRNRCSPQTKLGSCSVFKRDVRRTHLHQNDQQSDRSEVCGYCKIMDPHHGHMGHNGRRSSGLRHRLESDFGLCSLHQRQIQEGRIIAVRSLLFCTRRPA